MVATYRGVLEGISWTKYVSILQEAIDALVMAAKDAASRLNSEPHLPAKLRNRERYVFQRALRRALQERRIVFEEKGEIIVHEESYVGGFRGQVSGFLSK